MLSLIVLHKEDFMFWRTWICRKELCLPREFLLFILKRGCVICQGQALHSLIHLLRWLHSCSGLSQPGSASPESLQGLIPSLPAPEILCKISLSIACWRAQMSLYTWSQELGEALSIPACFQTTDRQYHTQLLVPSPLESQFTPCRISDTDSHWCTLALLHWIKSAAVWDAGRRKTSHLWPVQHQPFLSLHTQSSCPLLPDFGSSLPWLCTQSRAAFTSAALKSCQTNPRENLTCLGLALPGMLLVWRKQISSCMKIKWKEYNFENISFGKYPKIKKNWTFFKPEHWFIWGEFLRVFWLI